MAGQFSCHSPPAKASDSIRTTPTSSAA